MSGLGTAQRKKVVVLLHGILTGQTHPGWVDRLAHWLWMQDGGIECIKRRYTAGPFPMWNVFVKNRWLARALAEEISPYAEEGADVYFVTHSNGADIAIKTMKLLAAWGCGAQIRRIVMIAAAIPADVQKNGIEELLVSDHLDQAYAYCAGDDLALALAAWPYGRLGRTGFEREGTLWPRWRTDSDAGRLALTRCTSCFFDGYGHSGYFAPEAEPEIFAGIRADLFSTIP